MVKIQHPVISNTQQAIRHIMSKEKAFLFDLNGTMIDDMDFHIKAWHGILNGLGANISLAHDEGRMLW
jgi:phosphoglycolate phosphatase-like HAD superfamily hydrolase